MKYAFELPRLTREAFEGLKIIQEELRYQDDGARIDRCKYPTYYVITTSLPFVVVLKTLAREWPVEVNHLDDSVRRSPSTTFNYFDVFTGRPWIKRIDMQFHTAGGYHLLPPPEAKLVELSQELLPLLTKKKASPQRANQLLMELSDPSAGMINDKAAFLWPAVPTPLAFMIRSLTNVDANWSKRVVKPGLLASNGPFELNEAAVVKRIKRDVPADDADALVSEGEGFTDSENSEDWGDEGIYEP